MTNQTKIMKGSVATIILTALGYMTYSTAFIPVMTFPIVVSAFAVSGVYVGLAYAFYLAAQFLIPQLFKVSTHPNLVPIKSQGKPSVANSSPLREDLTNGPDINLQTSTPPTSLLQEIPPTSSSQTPSAINPMINIVIVAPRLEGSPPPARFQPSSSSGSHAEPGNYEVAQTISSSNSVDVSTISTSNSEGESKPEEIRDINEADVTEISGEDGDFDSPPPILLALDSPSGRQRCRSSINWQHRFALANNSPNLPAYWSSVQDIDAPVGSQVSLETGNRVSGRLNSPRRATPKRS